MRNADLDELAARQRAEGIPPLIAADHIVLRREKWRVKQAAYRARKRERALLAAGIAVLRPQRADSSTDR